MTRRRRDLTSGEKELWTRVSRSVTPLKPQPPAPEPPPVETEPPVPQQAGSPPEPAPRTPDPAPKTAPGPSRAPADLDRKTRRKLARGVVTIDGRIDLHGMTQEEAHGALVRFIVSSAGMRRRVVLVITGKGMGPARGFGEGRGVLRRSVPHWLTSRELAPHVVTFGPAHAAHGGDGALYVRLRTPKR
ncbi:Smr/MutS family protein [Acuticoccus yangtzensis]|uniref:Smr/MutS family protein n=1 Tax=Acuticoccus yangtzensis TaxID=1443441 RepID=UPI0009496693|nr:Smr/MutS family protein [Acuticoccus yangtzensis]